MKFLVRDDDACAMTRPEELERCYGGIWDEVPVCLSVTPFRVPGRMRGVPEALFGHTDPLPLADNAEMVAFLREQLRRGRIGVALHGYHHDRPGGQPEFVAGTDLHRKAREGRIYLESLLEAPVKTFVPPNNTLSAVGFDAVVAAGMNVVSNQTRARMRPWWSGADAAAEMLLTAGLALGRRLGRSDAHRIRVFPRYRQAPYVTVGPDHALPALLADLEACRSVEDVYVAATHYHAFERRMRSGETVREGVMRLVEAAQRRDDVRFVAYDGLW